VLFLSLLSPLIEDMASSSLFQCTLLMVLYRTGMRRAEVARLKIADIDSQRMVIHVVDSKDGLNHCDESYLILGSRSDSGRFAPLPFFLRDVCRSNQRKFSPLADNRPGLEAGHISPTMLGGTCCRFCTNQQGTNVGFRPVVSSAAHVHSN